MNNLSDFANFGELHFLGWKGLGGGGGGTKPKSAPRAPNTLATPAANLILQLAFAYTLCVATRQSSTRRLSASANNSEGIRLHVAEQGNFREFFRKFSGKIRNFTFPEKLQPYSYSWSEFKAMVGKNIYVIEIWKIYLSL